VIPEGDGGGSVEGGGQQRNNDAGDDKTGYLLLLARVENYVLFLFLPLPPVYTSSLCTITMVCDLIPSVGKAVGTQVCTPSRC